MNVYKANITIEFNGNEDDIKKFIDELETSVIFKPQFNIFRDFIGLEPSSKR